MRFSSLFLLALLNAFDVAALPSAETKRDAAAAAGCPYAKRAADPDVPQAIKDREEKLKKRAGFDLLGQRIDTSGEHKFVPPNFAAGDVRGPCPGLNALANHGYLPHNGVGSLQQYIDSTNTVYGMGRDLGGFLAVYGTVFDGNPLSLNPGFSMGGPSGNSNNILGNVAGLIGQPTGLTGSHNKYEGDTSPTRGDLYVEGNNYKIVIGQAKRYVQYIKEGLPSQAQYQALFPYRKERFDDSVNRNPYFFFPPFAGILASPAGYAFPKAMMANHSLLFPTGTLQIDNFKSFFSLSGDGDGLTYKEGYERIPDNWYRRPIGDDFTIPLYLADVLSFGVQDARLLSPGGNLNGVNTYGPVDVANLTGGVYSSVSLASGNNLECFIYQTMLETAPDALKGVFTDVSQALKPLSDFLSKRVSDLGCPQIKNFDDSFLSSFPGYKRSNGAM